MPENQESVVPSSRPKGTQANEAVPELAAVVPTVVTACGAIVAALSEPPELPRRSSSR